MKNHDVVEELAKISWCDRVIKAMRAEGVELAALTLRDDAGVEPDALRKIGYITPFGIKTRERSLFAPHFDWRFEDGRRFHAKTELHDRRVIRRELVSEHHDWAVDHQAQMNDLLALIRRSWKSGADTRSNDQG